MSMQYTKISPWQIGNGPIKCRFEWRNSLNCRLYLYIDDLDMDDVIDQIKECSAVQFSTAPWNPAVHVDPEHGRYITTSLPPSVQVHHQSKVQRISVESLYQYHQHTGKLVGSCLISLYSPRIWARQGSKEFPDARGISFQCYSIHVFDAESVLV